MSEKKKVMFVVNTASFFVSHRIEIARKAMESGYEVYAVTGSDEWVPFLREIGIKHINIDFHRGSYSFLNNVILSYRLLRAILIVRPDLIHLVTIKPVLFGGMLSRIVRVESIVYAISGLGTLFISNDKFAGFRRILAKLAYRLAIRRKDAKVICQNEDDQNFIRGLNVTSQKNIIKIKGSGVNLTEFSNTEIPNGVPVVVMASRLLVDKGVIEFVESARILRKRGCMVNMRLIGAPDPGNPSSISEKMLQDWYDCDYVEMLGRKTDIAAQYSSATVVCQPSYREGLPKSLIEAAACGRPVITTDVPGCRDAIISEVTGILVPARDSLYLANAIQRLVENPQLCKKMGQAGRELAEKEYGIETIVNHHMIIYQEMLREN